MENPISKREKPIDRWLGMGGIAVAFILYLIPTKTPRVVAGSLVLIFALLIHPVWHFWWIEAKLWRKLMATALLIVGLAYLGQVAWPSEAVASQPHFFEDFILWLSLPHGRWFDKVLGAVYALVAIFILSFLAALGKILNDKKSKQANLAKGFLDYKLQVEKSMSAMPPLLGKLTDLTNEVNQSVERLTRAFQTSGGSASKGLEASRVAAKHLDYYTSRMTRVHAKFGEEGRLFSEGLIGWSAWIQTLQPQPPRATLAPFGEALRHFKHSADVAIETMQGAIVAMASSKGAFGILDAAIDRQIQVRAAILRTSEELSEGCGMALSVFDALPVPQ